MKITYYNRIGCKFKIHKRHWPLTKKENNKINNIKFIKHFKLIYFTHSISVLKQTECKQRRKR